MEKPSFGQMFIFGLVEQFKAGARICEDGYEVEDVVVQRRGRKLINTIIQELDRLGPVGRDALVPLLDDQNPAIRVFAAGYLVKRLPERALAVLQDIAERCPTRTHMTASRILWAHERGALDL